MRAEYDNVPKILSPGEEVLKILESFTQTLAFDSSRSSSSSSAWVVASGKAREIRDKDTRISVKVCRKEATQMTANPHGNEQKSKQKSSRSSRREKKEAKEATMIGKMHAADCSIKIDW